MDIKIIKSAEKSASSAVSDVRDTVQTMLSDIEAGGEDKALAYARKLDNWQGEIIVSRQEIEAAAKATPQQIRDDIQFAHERVRKFAEAQKAAMTDCEVELSPGLWAGHRNVPMQVAGCYVPGGRYAHVASAIMSVTTARVAGVDRVIGCSPPKPNVGIAPAILYALDLCGVDTVLNLGGVQGIAALAFGLFGGAPADILVGPGNQYVAEAKRALYGRVGIDMFAGPTEILIIADSSADPEIVACDLVGQAEHGYNSPAWLISLDSELSRRVVELVPQMIADLPETNRINAEAAWRDYGEIKEVQDRETAAQLSDDYAAEHLEIQCTDLKWWHDRLRNYGSLFLGEETTVAFGDKCSGPNHILPTLRAAKYTGGLSVGKFMKTLSWQRMTRDANRDVAAVTARISRTEGMEAHARTADIRLKKWFSGETFETDI